MATIRVPGVLRDVVGGAPTVVTDATTVGDLLLRLPLEHPALASRLIGENGEWRPFVTLFLGDTDVRTLGPQTVIGSETEIIVLPAVSGG